MNPTPSLRKNTGARKRLVLVCIFALTVLIAVGASIFLRSKSPRAKAYDAALRLARAFDDNRSTDLGGLVRLPDFIAKKTAPEQSQLVSGILADEISSAGLAELRSRGEFGPLRELFPTEAAPWAAAFSVNPDNCVAFKMQRNGIRAELVLLQTDQQFVVLRCNNVKQMALASQQ